MFYDTSIGLVGRDRIALWELQTMTDMHEVGLSYGTKGRVSYVNNAIFYHLMLPDEFASVATIPEEDLGGFNGNRLSTFHSPSRLQRVPWSHSWVGGGRPPGCGLWAVDYLPIQYLSGASVVARR